jgi:hypothetical protein
MQITVNVPAPLQGQNANLLFDAPAAGLARGDGPTGILAATLTIPFALFCQAVKLGCTFNAWTPG